MNITNRVSTTDDPATRAVTDRIMLAIVLTLLGLNAGLAMAHVLEAPNKWRIPPEVRFVVQRDLYDGWGT